MFWASVLYAIAASVDSVTAAVGNTASADVEYKVVNIAPELIIAKTLVCR